MTLIPAAGQTVSLQAYRQRRGAEPRRPMAARQLASDPRGSAVEGAAVQLLARHRLDDDTLTGVEAVCARGRAVLSDPQASVLRQIAATGWGGVTIGITLPGAAFDPERIVGQVAMALDVATIAPARLELILGEAVLAEIDSDGLLALSALRDLGVGLCIDAFGAGVASLTLLRRLPLTRLKLARALTRAAPADREDAAILRAVISTAHAVGLSVTGDGIDSEEQRAVLGHAGCDEGQGPLFGPPLHLMTLPRHGILA